MPRRGPVVGPMSAELTAILHRHAALREHHDPAFAAHVARLRGWQARRLYARHADVAERARATPLLRYFAESFFRDLDLGELTGDPDAAGARLGRLLPDSRMLRDALAFATLTRELDEAVAERLAPDREIVAAAYVRAYREVGGLDDRRRQCGLAGDLAADLEGIARKRWAHMGFKLARGPAHAAGMGRLYDRIADGFDALRRLPDAAGAHRAVQRMLADERECIDRLLG